MNQYFLPFGSETSCGHLANLAVNTLELAPTKSGGGVAEWLKAPVLKTGIRASVSGVRIPSLPPLFVLQIKGSPDGDFFWWRGDRVAEGARFESVYTCKRIGGSNPPLSAISYSSKT